MHDRSDTSPRHLLSSGEAADRLEVAARTVAVWAERGLLPVCATVGAQRERAFDPAVIDELARERRAGKAAS